VRACMWGRALCQCVCVCSCVSARLYACLRHRGNWGPWESYFQR